MKHANQTKWTNQLSFIIQAKRWNSFTGLEKNEMVDNAFNEPCKFFSSFNVTIQYVIALLNNQSFIPIQVLSFIALFILWLRRQSWSNEISLVAL